MPFSLTDCKYRPYRQNQALVTFVFRFPGGEMVETVPRIHRFTTFDRPLRPGESIPFRVGFWLSDRGKELLARYNYKVAITAVVGGMGLQSNTLAFNGCRVPRWYSPLARTRFTPELHKAYVERLRAKFRALGANYPFDDE